MTALRCPSCSGEGYDSNGTQAYMHEFECRYTAPPVRTLAGRAQDAIDGFGPEGMYNDYDQACMWSGLVQELLAENRRLRSNIGWLENPEHR